MNTPMASLMLVMFCFFLDVNLTFCSWALNLTRLSDVGMTVAIVCIQMAEATSQHHAYFHSFWLIRLMFRFKVRYVFEIIQGQIQIYCWEYWGAQQRTTDWKYHQCVPTETRKGLASEDSVVADWRIVLTKWIWVFTFLANNRQHIYLFRNLLKYTMT